MAFPECHAMEVLMTPDLPEFDWSEEDLIPRYAPKHVLIMGHGECQVITYHYYPVGQRPRNLGIHPGMGVLELVTRHGSRLYGCKSAYINSELRMVVIGVLKGDEVRLKWREVPTKFSR